MARLLIGVKPSIWHEIPIEIYLQMASLISSRGCSDYSLFVKQSLFRLLCVKQSAFAEANMR